MMQKSKLQDEDNGIDMGSLIKSLWRWKYFILIGTVIFGIAGVCIGKIMFPKSYMTSCIVSMQFGGIENWKNPDNSPFDPRQVISPLVLSEVAALSPKDKKYSNIQENLDIEPFIPFEVKNKMKIATKKQEDFKYYPTQFKISFTTKNPDLYSRKEKSDVLYNIIECYKTYFKKEYGEAQFKDFNVKEDFLNNNEYIDIISMFDLLITNLNIFLDSKIEKAGKFRSSSTGMSFAQIKDNMLFIKRIQLNGVSSVIKKMNIAKDREKLINVMTYNLKNLEITKEKKANEALMALKLLEIQKKVMGIPADGQTSPANNSKDLSITMDSSFIETMKKNDYVASLIRTAMEADTASKNAETDIKYLKEDVEALTANVVVDEKWEKYVKKTIQEISSDLKIWTEILTRLDNEFMKVQLNDVIKSDSAPESFAVRSKNYYVLILLFGLIPLIAAILAAFVKEQMFAA